ncbi:MAG: hypothetical protein E6R03_03105 [Hyphomicrobiaceae bacterium]|nr:MAG: hypothetical protein E6R03_03105 [Hyphomicrobiaceae bacterium]
MNAVVQTELPGIKVLAYGPPGSGKTHSLRTLLDAGLEVFCIFTEPGMEVLSDTDPAKLHWNYIAPANPGWDAMIDNAKKITQFDAASLQKMPGMNKDKYQQFMGLLNVCKNYIDQRTGKSYGDITQFGTDKVVVLDSLSGLNTMLLDHAVGGKPIRTQPDWGIAIDNEERFLNLCCMGLKCHFILNAHVDRESDLILGGIKLMPSALGKKLPPLIGRFFSDVILTKRNGNGWSWSTAGGNDADTKARNLAWADKIPQDYKPLIDKWKSRQFVAKAS